MSGRSQAQLRAADRAVLWHPFTQMRAWGEEEFPVIVAGSGSWLVDADGRRYLDGISSLWCAIHGHRVPEIDAAICEQLGRVAHSTLLGLSSEPSIQLAEELLAVAPSASLGRVFYSDDGSTAVEIALKMAFQYFRQVEGKDTRRTRFLALRGGYHGDTIGAVSLGGIDLFHSLFQPLLFATDHVGTDLDEIDALLTREGGRYAALVLEPGVQGAAGMRVFPEGFTRALVERARARGILIVADEVATGFGRSGELFACTREGIEPDLLCLAKGLSGGYLPLAATLACGRVFEGFLGEHGTFFHGHTFTGNALACAAARASLALCRRPGFLPRALALGDELAAGLAPLEGRAQVRRYGAMFGVELRGFPPARRTGHRVTLAARRRGAILRPLGDTVVLMPPLNMTTQEAALLCGIAVEAIEEASAS